MGAAPGKVWLKRQSALARCELGEDFDFKSLELNVNQGWRPAEILARLGTEFLVEYEMPGGTTALRVMALDAQGCPFRFVRSVSYAKVPRRWRDAMEEAGTAWAREPQARAA